MAPYSVLSIGSHPNIAFYNWRLSRSNNVVLETISSTTILDSNNGNDHSVANPQPVNYSWVSNQFGNDTFTVQNVYSNIEDYTALVNHQNNNLDFIFLSATSLQELSTLCSFLSNILKIQISNHNVPTIIIESTNFVNLEPFVKMSLQLDDQIPILSIMSDFDVRELNNNKYLVNKSKKESELLYVGKSGRENSYTSQEVNLINKIADLFESPNIDVYKLNTPLEFLSYQWKFALPKITVESLSIIFEKPFPIDLQNQILAKPLISGLIFEIITVIKTMGCKLFNSYDNEISLLDRLSQLYPPVDLSPDASETPKLYYDFFNQNQLYLDLLLLQPILIADDYQVKTPYLEFLYAVMSQYSNNNFSTLENPSSIFWVRKNSKSIRQLKTEQDELVNKIATLELNQKSLKESANSFNKPLSPSRNVYRSSTDPAIDPELEELSDVANSYNLTNKTPPNQNREFITPMSNNNNNNNNNSNNGMNQPKTPLHNGMYQNQPQSQNNLQPAFPNNNGNASPNFMPQQNLPHGLPSQGLPPHQPIFNNSQQNSGPPSRRNFYNGPPPMQSQNSYPQSNGYNSQSFPPPMNNMNMYNSRDDVSYMSGRASSYMGQPNNYDNSFNSMNGGMPGNMPGNMPNHSNRQFKPTSRKSSRKSAAVLTNSIVGGYNDVSNGMNAGMNRGMPARHSMAPNMSSNRMSSMGNPNMRNGLNNGAPSSFSPPIMNSMTMNGSGDKLSNNSTTSLGGIQGNNSPQAKASTPELVPVPEATPAPTPAYIPTQEGKGNSEKKKKRGFLGLGKKKEKS